MRRRPHRVVLALRAVVATRRVTCSERRGAVHRDDEGAELRDLRELATVPFHSRRRVRGARRKGTQLAARTKRLSLEAADMMGGALPRLPVVVNLGALLYI